MREKINLEPVCPECRDPNITVTTPMQWNVRAQCWKPPNPTAIARAAYCNNCETGGLTPIWENVGGIR